MGFPDRAEYSLDDFVGEYAAHVSEGLRGLDRAALGRAVAILRTATQAGRRIYACGNGGSAAISDHLACDHLKGVATNTTLRPRVHSLAANGPLCTAISNDFSYAEVFSYQVRALGESGDVLIAISSSGNSENIVAALAAARERGMRTIAMVGFDGGRAAGSAEVVLHIKQHNYGIVEDCHQSIMHILAQFIRLHALDAASDVRALKF